MTLVSKTKFPGLDVSCRQRSPQGNTHCYHEHSITMNTQSPGLQQDIAVIRAARARIPGQMTMPFTLPA